MPADRVVLEEEVLALLATEMLVVMVQLIQVLVEVVVNIIMVPVAMVVRELQ
jgi:hypothetical protein